MLLLQLAKAQESLYKMECHLVEQRIFVTRLLLQHHFRTFSKFEKASKAVEADIAHIAKSIHFNESLTGKSLIFILMAIGLMPDQL